MNAFFYISLFLFGLVFGSFASVIIYRLRSGEGGIWGGRSHCGSCNTILKSIELIPVVSWVLQRGKCKNCKKQIAAIYPLLEICTGLMFALTGYFLIDFSLILAGNLLEIGTLLFYLSISFLTIIYVFYDILFLEIPEIILLIAIVLTAIVVVVQSLVPGVHIIHTLPWANGASEISSIGVVLSIGIIGSLYAIMLKGWKEILDALILFIAIAILYFFSTTSFSSITSIPFIHAIIGVLGIFIFFFLQIVLSRGTWMGEGDLRIAILVGLFLGMTYSFIGMMITYFIGSIIGVTMILYSKYILKHKEVQTQVPFGPFLAIGMFVTLWYTEEIANLISFYL